MFELYFTFFVIQYTSENGVLGLFFSMTVFNIRAWPSSWCGHRTQKPAQPTTITLRTMQPHLPLFKLFRLCSRRLYGRSPPPNQATIRLSQLVSLIRRLARSHWLISNQVNFFLQRNVAFTSNHTSGLAYRTAC